MAKQNGQYTRRSVCNRGEAYIWYVELLVKTYNAVDWTFCDAINPDYNSDTITIF